MKHTAMRIAALLLVLLLAGTAAAESVTADYTLAEKLYKQLQAGNGLEGTLTLSADAVQGRESEALTTIQPLTFDLRYIYVREDSVTRSPAENRMTLSMTDGDKTPASLEVSVKNGDVFLQSTLLGDGWYCIGSRTQSDSSAEGAVQSMLTQAAQGSAIPGLLSFAAGVLMHSEGLNANLEEALADYNIKVDLWIEGYRQGAELGKLNDGTTTMETKYVIPAAAVKSQLKQLVLDALNDSSLLQKLSELMSAEDAATFLDPSLQAYYFYAIDELPLNDDLTIARTVSLKGDTLALTMEMPLVDSVSGAATFRYSRVAGEGDLPDVNTVELQNDRVLWKIDYNEYSTMNDTTVYQGTLLRMPQGIDTFTVDEQSSERSEQVKTLSAAFTLTGRQSLTTDAEGLGVLTYSMELNLTPDYTPDSTDDETLLPTADQQDQYIVFPALNVGLDATFTSGQAKNKSTALDAKLVVSGETMPQTLTLTFTGKTKSRWDVTAFDADAATSVADMDADARTALLAQLGVKGGLVLLPYVSLPTANAAVTAQPSEQVAADDAPTDAPADEATDAPSTEAAPAQEPTATLIPTISPAP